MGGGGGLLGLGEKHYFCRLPFVKGDTVLKEKLTIKGGFAMPSTFLELVKNVSTEGACK